MLKKIIYHLNVYRIYYRIYYYLFGKRRIENPCEVVPPKDAIECFAEFDPESKKHQNFLYAKVKLRKWFYWIRKFAYRIGDGPWLLLPRLTPWGTENGLTKFGLNFTFVQRLSLDERNRVKFVTWL